MKLVVTGASGFVGRAFCAEASRRGHEVVALVRRVDATLVASRQVIIPSIETISTWMPLIDGADAVVHAAAHVHVLHPEEEDAARFTAVNVDATRALATAAAASGAFLLFVSSVKVHGDTAGHALTADSAIHPSDPYGRSKAEGEDAVRQVAASDGLRASVIRPPLVYGPGVSANFLKLMELARRRVPLPFASLTNRRSLIYVGNLVDAMMFVCGGQFTGETFVVSDGDDVSTPLLIRRMAAALGVAPRLLPFPPALLRALLRRVSSGAADRLTGSLFVDADPLRSRGWYAPYTMEEGLAATAAAMARVPR